MKCNTFREKRARKETPEKKAKREHLLLAIAQYRLEDHICAIRIISLDHLRPKFTHKSLRTVTD